MQFLRLIRFPNLLVIGLTQWLVAARIFGQAYAKTGQAPVLNTLELSLLIGGTLALCAAGYIINDLLDQDIDQINRPRRVVVHHRISLGTVRWLVACFTILGFILSLLLALLKQELDWLWLYPVFALLLGLYPNWLKMRPFLGNLFIAFCCAGVAGLIWLAERAAWLQLPAREARYCAEIMLLFMAYAFLATWIRELVKDLEDQQGDAELGRRTLPVYWGTERTKKLLHLLAGLLAAALLMGVLLGWEGLLHLPVFACSMALLVWLLVLQVQLQRAESSRQYHGLSQQWKFYLLGGLLLLFIYQI
jgi:4-hydroxybenzoate polyprenyltransferase